MGAIGLYIYALIAFASIWKDQRAERRPHREVH